LKNDLGNWGALPDGVDLAGFAAAGSVLYKVIGEISITGTGLCMVPKAGYPVVVAGLPKSQNDLTSLTGRLWRRGKDEPEAL
jgi:hypothetical protein